MITALVTGALGQDGTYLARLLADKGVRVVGAVRDCARFAPPGLELIAWDLADIRAMVATLAAVRPTHVYNLAAFSSGVGMWDDPVAIGEVNGLAVARLLEAIRQTDPAIRFVQAGSSEMFGRPYTSPQNETTPFRPRSPYGAAKVFAHHMIEHYRERHGLFACSAILYNHESPLRRPEFVTRKITRAAARIALGLEREVRIGALGARRDWGYAGDTARALMLMGEADAPGDYVIATGITHSVEDLCRTAFVHVGLDWREHVREEPGAARPPEPVELVGDASQARDRLGWRPQVDFGQLIHSMVDADLESARRDISTKDAM